MKKFTIQSVRFFSTEEQFKEYCDRAHDVGAFPDQVYKDLLEKGRAEFVSKDQVSTGPAISVYRLEECEDSRVPR